MERKIQIEIDVTPEGDLVYRPAVLRASRGATILFTAGGRAFTAMFYDKTPFDKVVIESKGGGPSLATEAKVVGPPGLYSFAVGLLHDGRILLDPKCPEIIIQ
jgi:plastocyanin